MSSVHDIFYHVHFVTIGVGTMDILLHSYISFKLKFLFCLFSRIDVYIHCPVRRVKSEQSIFRSVDSFYLLSFLFSVHEIFKTFRKRFIRNLMAISFCLAVCSFALIQLLFVSAFQCCGLLSISMFMNRLVQFQPTQIYETQRKCANLIVQRE